MPAGTKGPVLEYTTPRPPSSVAGRFAKNVAFLFPIVFVAMIAGFVTPEKEWYFGNHPQWVIETHDDQFSIGRYDQRIYFYGQPFTFIVTFIKMSMVGVPLWFIGNSIARGRNRQRPLAVQQNLPGVGDGYGPTNDQAKKECELRA